MDLKKAAETSPSFVAGASDAAAPVPVARETGLRLPPRIRRLASGKITLPVPAPSVPRRADAHGLPHSQIATATLLIALLWGVIYAVRLAAPTEVMDNDQERPIAYVMDVLQNGDWIVQTDNSGDITSKPPLYTWLASLAALAMGQLNLLALTLPTAISTLALALLVLWIGARFFSIQAGVAGSLMYLVSQPAIRQVLLIRTDGLFSLFTFAGVLSLYFALTGRRSWLWFWLLAALGTLAKFPLGVLLAAGGAFAVTWERASSWADSPVAGRRSWLKEHAAGLLLLVVVAGGWFLLAWWVEGQALLDKMIGRELVRHATESKGGASFGSDPWKSPLFLLSRMLPWSLLFIPLGWRLVRKPAENPEARLMERVLTAYVLFGLLVFALGPHKRADHYLPLIPAAALLAGTEAVRWINLPLRRRGVYYALGATGLLAVGLVGYYYIARPYDTKVLRSGIMRDFAREVRREAGEDFPFTNADVPMGFLYYYGELRLEAGRERVARALEGPLPVFALVEEMGKLRKELSDPEMPLHELIVWPPKPEGEEKRTVPHPHLPLKRFEQSVRGRVVSNHPRLEIPPRYVVLTESLRIECRQVRLVDHTEHEVTVVAEHDMSSARILNESERPVKMRVHWQAGETRRTASVTIAPGAEFIADKFTAWQ